MAQDLSPAETLFFIPDIGGFTQFMVETEIRHSRHIIRELLELLVGANTLGLRVSEIEGDAVLFYREGAPPTLAELVAQARRMYIDFHSYLQKFELARICQCGACAGVPGLSLKMVAHFGTAVSERIRDHVQFLGKDIIVAHRLLKNSVTEREYMLVSEDTLLRLDDAPDVRADFSRGADSYDSLGTIDYAIKPLAPYRAEVQVTPPAPAGIPNPRLMSRLTRHIRAPMKDVYQVLIDLPRRLEWIEGATRVEMADDSPNELGKVHRCVRGDEGLALMTTDVQVSEGRIELCETDLKQISASRYVLTAAPNHSVDVAVELYVRDNLLVRTLFRLLMAKKLGAFFASSLDNLAMLSERRRASDPDPSGA